MRLRVGPFSELWQLIVDRIPLGFGSYELMILRDNSPVIVKNAKADIGKLGKSRVLGEKWCSTLTAELFAEAICNFTGRNLVRAPSNTQVGCSYFDISSKRRSAKFSANGAITKTRVGRLTVEFKLDSCALTLSRSLAQWCA
jgi:hypothetical protein